MDLTFLSEEGIFNCRTSALIIHEQHILAMHDDNISHYYLPGGRISLHETAENALLRELKEELGIDAHITRLCWIDQCFYTIRNQNCHELCFYFLTDITGTGLMEMGKSFTRTEGRCVHSFEWLSFDRLKEADFYPLFLKDQICDLPLHTTLITEQES